MSTAGVVPRIRGLLELGPLNLAVSLHATTDALRDELVPLNRRYPLAELLGALRAEELVSRRRPVFFEYTLIGGVNDGLEEARRLPRLLRGIPSKVNVIPYNDHPGSAYRAPSREAVDAFTAALHAGGIRVTLRRNRGTDIDAACGQLAARGLPPPPGGWSGSSPREDWPKRRLRGIDAGMLYAVGDIHGELEKLDELLASLPLRDGDRLVFLGDYVDRGPDSHGVIERLVRFQRDWPCVFLLGNHESMLLDFLGWTDRSYFGGDAFLMNGGDRTLASYGYFDREQPDRETFRLPKQHEDFLLSLELYHLEGDYLFVHAGLGRSELQESDVAYALRRSRPEDLLWNRTSCELPHQLGVTLVYGHTPSEDFEVRWNPPFSIGIDTGAVYGGPLTAVRLPDETVFQV